MIPSVPSHPSIHPSLAFSFLCSLYPTVPGRKGTRPLQNNIPLLPLVAKTPVLLSVYLLYPLGLPQSPPITFQAVPLRGCSTNDIHTLSCRNRTQINIGTKPRPRENHVSFRLHPHNADVPSKFCLMIRSITAFCEDPLSVALYPTRSSQGTPVAQS